jgi:hypothetical protein
MRGIVYLAILVGLCDGCKVRDPNRLSGSSSCWRDPGQIFSASSRFQGENFEPESFKEWYTIFLEMWTDYSVISQSDPSFVEGYNFEVELIEKATGDSLRLPYKLLTHQTPFLSQTFLMAVDHGLFNQDDVASAFQKFIKPSENFKPQRFSIFEALKDHGKDGFFLHALWGHAYLDSFGAVLNPPQYPTLSIIQDKKILDTAHFTFEQFDSFIFRKPHQLRFDNGVALWGIRYNLSSPIEQSMENPVPLYLADRLGGKGLGFSTYLNPLDIIVMNDSIPENIFLGPKLEAIDKILNPQDALPEQVGGTPSGPQSSELAQSKSDPNRIGGALSEEYIDQKVKEDLAKVVNQRLESLRQKEISKSGIDQQKVDPSEAEKRYEELRHLDATQLGGSVYRVNPFNLAFNFANDEFDFYQRVEKNVPSRLGEYIGSNSHEVVSKLNSPGSVWSIKKINIRRIGRVTECELLQ